MQISDVQIFNFRALEKISVSLDRFSVLLGENDVGKTSFLHALNKFFEGKKLDDKRDWFKEDTSKEIRIVLTFKDLPDDAQLAPLRRADGTVVVSKAFGHGVAPVVRAILADGSAVAVGKPVLDQHFSIGSFHFVPVRRDLAVQFSMGKTALLGKTLRAKMKAAMESDEVGESLQEVEETLRNSIEEPRKRLEIFLQQQLNNDGVKLGFESLEVDPIEGVSFEVCLSDDKVNRIPIENRGAGTQNNLIIALFRLIAEVNIGGRVIFAMEEPENSLHPKAQRQLLSVIQKIAEQSQVIVTTHSPVFIDRSKFENNILLTRTASGCTIPKSFNSDELEAVRADLGIRASDALLKGGGNCAILVEGSTEEDGFPVFMEMLGMSEFRLGIAIINLGGSDKEKIRSTAKLLKAYEIPCVLVLDRDASKCAEDIKRESDKGDLNNVRHVFCLSKGMIEDYYPLDVVAHVINSRFSPKKPITAESFDAKKSGQARHDDFKRVMYEHGAGVSLEYLKGQLGAFGTAYLAARGDKVDQELAEIFAAVKDIAEKV
jgi:putative ATP-dependent endonuclease of OLD family